MRKSISYALSAAAVLATSALAQDRYTDPANDPNSRMNRDSTRARRLGDRKAGR